MTSQAGLNDRRARHLYRLRALASISDEQIDRRRLSHDIQHQLSTIALLASSVVAAGDGDDGRRFAEQIVDEARWLSGLVRMYEDDFANGHEAAPVPTRLDLLAASVLQPLLLSCDARVCLEATPVSTVVSRLDLWRALRNVVLNAVTAAGAGGRVVVRVLSRDGRAVIEVHDDGPGCDPEAARRSALGLAIVNDVAVKSGGCMTIAAGSPRGAVVRLDFPEAS
jgi:signal transduction histidine kinase